MNAIPGGYETDSDSYSDDDYEKGLVYTNDPLKRGRTEEPVVSSFVNASKDPASNGIRKVDDKPKNDRKAFLWPPKPPQRSRSPSPSTALVLDDIRTAVLNGNLESVKSKVEKDSFFVDTVLRAGWTPLMYAASSAQPEIVNYLLEKSADPNFQTKDDYTALMAACSSNESDEKKLLECVHFLLRFGADCNQKDKFSNTPLLLASKKAKPLVASELIVAGADVNVQDKEGWTPLHCAANSGCGKLVQQLIENRANVNMQSYKNQTAAEIAFDRQFKEIGNIIERVQKTNDRKLSEAEINSLQTPEKPVKRLDVSNLGSSQHRYIDELDTFLSHLDLSEYLQTFVDHKISFRELLTLSEEDLDKMGIDKLGVKKKIIAGIKDVHKSRWRNRSLPNLKALETISCPDAVAMMANIAKHLAYIDQTVNYLRIQINKNPRILEYGQEAGNVQHLISENHLCLENSKKIFDEVKYFTNDLDKVKNNVELNQADVIDGKVVNYTERASITQVFVVAPVVIAAAIVGGIFMLKYKVQ